ncbi:hypothetical protein AKJ57_01855 [candidate division MSBL1 archaeon SCGC-AAA259A05]|uniref:Uncharacterized protein n=1 Tax=candidate division MSBL1 archaeon SCGC-AAA259A05 TaxID=1698259 RepID=A0A133UAU8_9EURY|nr:hypothetical protein AKJ57_01855 [candidate division MSBL1 archaeon SCGC-AAA259A05]
MVARRKPMEIFRASFKKAELVAEVFELASTPGEIRDVVRSDFFDLAEDIQKSYPAIGTFLELALHGIDKVTEDIQERRNLLERTIYELSIVPAITATERYVKRVHEIYEEEEHDHTIGSIEAMQDALPSDKGRSSQVIPQ